MRVQNIVSDVRSRVETAGRNYQDAFKAYLAAQRQVVSVVTRNGQTLANTEIGAAKNLFAAARASFDKARRNGATEVAGDPQSYVPNGRAQIVSAYKDTINLLLRTANELTDAVSGGYKSVLDTLAGRADTADAESASTTRSAQATTSDSASGKRKTASTRSAEAKSATTARKRTAATAGNSASASKSTTTKAKASPTKTGNTAQGTSNNAS